jgi:hypothetical protein
VLELKNINAIFDTGTTMIVGDPAGIMDFFAPLELSSGAEEVPDSPGYYTSTWAKFAADQPSQQYLIIVFFFLNLAVPCDFDTPISIYVGGKEIRISPDTFNLGPISNGSEICLAGAASDEELIGGKLALKAILRTKLTWVQNSGFSVMSSCGTLTLLGMLVTAASALLTLLEKLEHRFLSW